MPRAPSKAKKAKKCDRFADFAAAWERRRTAPNRGGGDWLIDKPDLPLDAVPFLQTLRRLGYVTQDRRFTELHQLIMQSVLIDLGTGRLSRYKTTLENPESRFACELIQEGIEAGLRSGWQSI